MSAPPASWCAVAERAPRRVLVTGASRGLGLAIARQLVRSGFRVVALARREGAELAAMAQETPEALAFRPFDLSDIEGIPALVKSLRREFGGFHGLVNNAGIGTAGLLASMPEAAIERLIRLNLLSPVTLTKHLVRTMMAGQAASAQAPQAASAQAPLAVTGGGRIVSISSVVGLTGYQGLSVYSATKAALIGFTRALARELGPLGITVNAVAPGFVATEMTHDLTPAQRSRIAHRSALQRLPEADDVAQAVDFLFGPGAGNITGTVMTVDAGNTA